MNPVWLIDDDRSIRWVFEKALTREAIAFKKYEFDANGVEMIHGDSGGVLFIGTEGKILVNRGKFEATPTSLAEAPLSS